MSSNSLAGRPLCPSLIASMIRTSKGVMRTPAHNGSWGNNKFRAMADPNNSASSVETIAISATSKGHLLGTLGFPTKKNLHSTYKGYRQSRLTRRGYRG